MDTSRENEQFRTLPLISSNGSELSSGDEIVDNDVLAAEGARLLFACYRKGDANDPDLYVTAIAAVLSKYPPEVIKRVTDPNTGIQTVEKFRAFPPNVGELKAHCEAEMPRPYDFDRYKPQKELPHHAPPLPTGPGRRANVFVPKTAPQYATMLEKAGEPYADPADWRREIDGIWVVLSWIR